ncbi:MAG TPA: nitroreductase family protein [bacterium]|nr:nitroreductase family protein [bacterium]
MRIKQASRPTPTDPGLGMEPIQLPKPDQKGGRPILSALKKRKTDRSISGKALSPRVLSNLLWAACGINRLKGPFGDPGRTAASASNSQEVDLYVALKEGVYRYEPAPHRLELVVAGDLRALAISRGQSPAGANAPVRLLFVVDIHKFSQAGFQEPGLWNPETQKAYYYVDTGLIAGNVYLFAASQGLACWFHNCERAALFTRLKLKPSQRVLFGQTVGYKSTGR